MNFEMSVYLSSLLWFLSKAASQKLYNLLENVGHYPQYDSGWILLILMLVLRYIAVCHLLQNQQHCRNTQVACLCKHKRKKKFSFSKGNNCDLD